MVEPGVEPMTSCPSILYAMGKGKKGHGEEGFSKCRCNMNQLFKAPSKTNAVVRPHGRTHLLLRTA